MIKDLQHQFAHNKSTYPDQLNLRLHRALSWLQKSQETQDDLDMQFISLWISFNAIYAKKMSERSPDRANFLEFLNLICRLDLKDIIYHIIWQKFPQSIRVMLDNRYVFQPFWDYHNGKISEVAWLEDFDKSNKKAYQALEILTRYLLLSLIGFIR